MDDETHKARLSKAESSERLIASAVALMTDQPIGKVSALQICAHAGLDKMTVRYCFGSYAGLLIATALSLGRNLSTHIHGGVFDETAYLDPSATLFGRLIAYLFTSLGDEVPEVEFEQMPNFMIIERQIADLYGIRPELARALAKRTALLAVATVAIDRFIPVTARERVILKRAQLQMFSDLAKVQDQLLE